MFQLPGLSVDDPIELHEMHHLLPGPTPEPAPVDLLTLVAQYDWPVAQALAITSCESTRGLDPRTYDLSRPDGGPFQINKASWEDWFLAQYGWTWSQVVQDLVTHVHAAYIIFTRAGRTWTPWYRCALGAGFI